MDVSLIHGSLACKAFILKLKAEVNFMSVCLSPDKLTSSVLLLTGYMFSQTGLGRVVNLYVVMFKSSLRK